MEITYYWTHCGSVFNCWLINSIFTCVLFPRESINSLKRKYSQSSELTDSDAAIGRTLNEVAKEGCQFLLDEVFLDLEVRSSVLLNFLLLCFSSFHILLAYIVSRCFPQTMNLLNSATKTEFHGLMQFSCSFELN